MGDGFALKHGKLWVRLWSLMQRKIRAEVCLNNLSQIDLHELMVAIKISPCCTGSFRAIGLEESKNLWKQEATPWGRSHGTRIEVQHKHKGCKDTKSKHKLCPEPRDKQHSVSLDPGHIWYIWNQHVPDVGSRHYVAVCGWIERVWRHKGRG